MVSTQQVDPAQRLAFWTDMVCNTYVQLDCDAAAGHTSIEGDIAAATLASLQLSCVTASAQKVRRTPAQIARVSEDYFLVSIQSQGEALILQDDRVAHLRPGDFALYDSTRPYELRFDGPFQQYVLRLPGPTLRTALRHTPSLTASTVSGQRGAGHLMIGMIRTLAAGIDTLAPESAHAVAESVTQILIAGLSGLPAAHQAPVSQLTVHGRPRFAKLSARNGSKVRIAPVHPDFGCETVSLSLMGSAGRHLDRLHALLVPRSTRAMPTTVQPVLPSLADRPSNRRWESPCLADVVGAPFPLAGRAGGSVVSRTSVKPRATYAAA